MLNDSCKKYRDKANFYIKKKSSLLDMCGVNDVTISFSERCLPEHINFIKGYMNYNENVLLVLDRQLHQDFCFDEFSQRIVYVDLNNPYILSYYPHLFICFGDEEYTNFLTENCSRYAYMNLFNEQNLFLNFLGAIHMSMNEFFLALKNKKFFSIVERRFSLDVAKLCHDRYDEKWLYEIFEKDVLRFKIELNSTIVDFYNELFEYSLPPDKLLELYESNDKNSNYMYISLALDFPAFKAIIGKLLRRWVVFENSIIYKNNFNIKIFQ